MSPTREGLARAQRVTSDRGSGDAFAGVVIKAVVLSETAWTTASERST